MKSSNLEQFLLCVGTDGTIRRPLTVTTYRKQLLCFKPQWSTKLNKGGFSRCRLQKVWCQLQHHSDDNKSVRFYCKTVAVFPFFLSVPCLWKMYTVFQGNRKSLQEHFSNLTAAVTNARNQHRTDSQHLEIQSFAHFKLPCCSCWQTTNSVETNNPSHSHLHLLRVSN